MEMLHIFDVFALRLRPGSPLSAVSAKRQVFLHNRMLHQHGGDCTLVVMVVFLVMVVVVEVVMMVTVCI